MKIGIIGCQSKHAEFFGSLFGKDEFADCRVKCILPCDEPQRLAYVRSLIGPVPAAASAAELIAGCDAVLVCTRLADTHAGYVKACLAAGKPVFVDKPFAADGAQAREMLALAVNRDTVLCGGSTFCFVAANAALRDTLCQSQTILIRYYADPDSPFGGYSFYGSHLCDLCAFYFGAAGSVLSSRSGKLVTSVVNYQKRQVVLQSSPEFAGLQVVADRDGRLQTYELNDTDCYRAGMDAFIGAVRGGARPECGYLADSVQLLGALLLSLADGKTHRVDE